MTGGRSKRTLTHEKEKGEICWKEEEEKTTVGGGGGHKGMQKFPCDWCARTSVCVCVCVCVYTQAAVRACTALTMRRTDKKESAIQHYRRR